MGGGSQLQNENIVFDEIVKGMAATPIALPLDQLLLGVYMFPQEISMIANTKNVF